MVFKMVLQMMNYIVYQIIGRALVGAGFAGSEVVKLKPLSLSCNIDNWRREYQAYNANYHPAVGAVFSPGSLKYRLSQFLRKVRTDLSCLEDDEDLASLLETFQVILNDDITRTARGN